MRKILRKTELLKGEKIFNVKDSEGGRERDDRRGGRMEGGRTQRRDERNEEQTGEGKRKKEKREGEERSIGGRQV